KTVDTTRLIFDVALPLCTPRPDIFRRCESQPTVSVATALATHTAHRLAITRCPAGDHHLALGIETHHVAPLGVQRAEEGAFRSAEGKIGHRGRHANVDPDIAGLYTIAKFTCRETAAGKDGRGIPVGIGIKEGNGLVKSMHRCHPDHRPEDLLVVHAHLRVHVVEDSGSDEIALRILRYARGAAVQDGLGAFLHAVCNGRHDPLTRRSRYHRPEFHPRLES